MRHDDERSDPSLPPRLSCAEVEDLLGAYAFGALPADEAQAVNAHLDTCPIHTAPLHDLRDIVELFPYAAEELSAPPGVGQRIHAAALADLAARVPAPAIGLSPAQRIQRQNRPERSTVAALTLSTTIAALLAVGLGLWGHSLHRKLKGQALS